MNNICDRKNCTGCGLCSNVCPKGAISMVEAGDTGHFIPYIDNSLCIDCKLCQKKCPGLREPDYKQQIATYAAWKKDIKAINGSSSGGVAAAFYEKALNEGYYIVGTYLNETFEAELLLTNKKDDIDRFKGSKYIQADTKQVYKEAFNLLKTGNKVLFAGTPCQCAAMRTMAEGIDDNNLITVELICHGTPSQKVFHEYINGIAKKKKKSITKVSFRSSTGIELSLFSGEKVFWQYKGYEDDYMVAFQEGLIHNTSCYSCKYANKDRASDITIGDFWKIGEKKPFEKPACKVSVVIANSNKGLEFINSCDNLELHERDYEEALYGNPNLIRPSSKNENYEVFWKLYNDAGVCNAFRKTIGKRLVKIRIKNRVKAQIKSIIKK